MTGPFQQNISWRWAKCDRNSLGRTTVLYFFSGLSVTRSQNAARLPGLGWSETNNEDLYRGKRVAAAAWLRLMERIGRERERERERERCTPRFPALKSKRFIFKFLTSMLILFSVNQKMFIHPIDISLGSLLWAREHRSPCSPSEVWKINRFSG